MRRSDSGNAVISSSKSDQPARPVLGADRERPAIGAPAAVINAVADALSPFGVELTRFPLTPAAIVAALDGATSVAS